MPRLKVIGRKNNTNLQVNRWTILKSKFTQIITVSQRLIIKVNQNHKKIMSKICRKIIVL